MSTHGEGVRAGVAVTLAPFFYIVIDAMRKEGALAPTAKGDTNMALYRIRRTDSGVFRVVATYGPKGTDKRQESLTAQNEDEVRTALSALQGWVAYQRPRRANREVLLQSLDWGENDGSSR